MYRYYSLFSGVLLILMMIACKSSPAEEGLIPLYQFPEDWLGKWEGDLKIFNKEGVNMELTMALDLEEMESDSLYQWTLKYISEERTDERKYFLKKGYDHENHWIVDEDNGILLDGYVLSNCLYVLFEVGNNRIQTSYTLEGNEMIFENLVSAVEKIRTSGDIMKDSITIPPVNSFVVSGLQRSILKKKNN